MIQEIIDTEKQILTMPWKEFLHEIEDYVSKRSHIDRTPDLIQEGLKVFMKYPNAVSASLFMLKDNSFEFEFRTSVPAINIDENKALFMKLVETGKVGSALESGNIISAGSNNPVSGILIVPLVASWGILGIILLESKEINYETDKMQIRLVSLMSGLFAGALENSYLFKNLGATKATLEQKVAARTMDLAQSQRELKAILDYVQTGIFVIDINTNQVVKCNPVAIDLIKDLPSNIIGANVHRFLEEVDYASRPQSLLTNYAVQNFESFLKAADGTEIPILRTSAFVNLGVNKYRIESFLDITEIKQYQDELQQANEYLEMKVQERTLDLQLLIKKLKDEIQEKTNAQSELKKMLDKEKELSELKTRFVSMVSHEFRTPLTVIRSAAQMLDKFKLKLNPFEQEEYLQRIVKTVDNLTDLIENVIFIGKQEQDRNDPVPTLLNLVGFTEGLIKEFEMGLLKPRQINFNTVGANISVVSNEKLLRLIIINLLSNAAKYSFDTPIDITLYCNNDNYTYVITDYGIGIPEEEQEKIFRMFYRADNVGKVAGTGIGLPVVLNSVQLLKGKINLESKMNSGTTFTITIPHIKFEEGI